MTSTGHKVWSAFGMRQKTDVVQIDTDSGNYPPSGRSEIYCKKWKCCFWGRLGAEYAENYFWDVGCCCVGRSFASNLPRTTQDGVPAKARRRLYQAADRSGKVRRAWNSTQGINPYHNKKSDENFSQSIEFAGARKTRERGLRELPRQIRRDCGPDGFPREK
jgi:hypothetical protein